MTMRRTALAAAMVVLSIAASSLQAQTVQSIRAADVNRDGFLTRDELVNFFLKDNPSPTSADRRAAESFAEDVLSMRCSEACERVDLNQAIEFEQDMERRVNEARRGKQVFLWQGLRLSRQVVDAPNPRGDKLRAPFILSFLHDEESDLEDQISILGGAQLYYFGTDIRDNLTFSARPSIDADVPGGKAPEERSLSFGVPVSLMWVPDYRWLESVSISVTPKFITDWPLERRVYELALGVSPNSSPVAAGFIRPARIREDGKLPVVSVVWVPSAQLEFGTIDDPGDNAELAALAAEGTYARVPLRAQVSLYPNFISDRLRVDWDATRRFDLEEGWHRDLMEARVSYDLVVAGTAQLTVVHRRGYRPPAFGRINQVLLGIGLQI